jgi:hypothetical protein
MALSHDNLANYYTMNFQLIQHHKYSLSEIEEMMPWEREVYMTLLSEFIKEENMRAEQQGIRS